MYCSAHKQDRFAIELSPATLEFIPLPSRYLISDTYWRRFTLLGQSLGSVYLAWEGLCGAEGVWPDIFIGELEGFVPQELTSDSMGYGFVLPFIRFITGGEAAIGAYAHYPTVSTDMVKRVRERSAGVENGGVASSGWKTQVKLAYYHIFTGLYSLALLFSEHTMTNSSWTQAHIKSLLNSGRASVGASILLMDESSDVARELRGEQDKEDRPRCEVVYPPCDTRELAKLGNLKSRKRELVSLAQFRPEKDHAKQIHALAILLESHPEYKNKQRVHLTLMGGSRGPADEARLDALRKLSKELDVEVGTLTLCLLTHQDNVTFLVNAPYPEIVRRLGEASIGLNTMQDEHFGINVVEFMES
jgi:alpha-1,2-mannosyltransferase